MKLSAEQFAELMASFRTEPVQTRHERRRAARLELAARVAITPIIGSQRLPTTTVSVADFSARGLAILNPAEMTAGQQFITTLARKTGGTVSLLCTVMHCRRVAANLYRVGAEFTCSAPRADAADEDAAEMERIRQSVLG